VFISLTERKLRNEANPNDDGTNDVACASYIEKDNAIGELNAVESDEEWEELSEVFDSFLLDAEEDSEEE
jgi:uncharacterized protein YrzB (UPF0473 family)